MSNIIDFDLLKYNQEYFNSIQELIVPDFQFNILLTPDNAIDEENNSIGKNHLNLFSNFIQHLKVHLVDCNITTGKFSFLINYNSTQIDIAIIGLLALFKDDFPDIIVEIELHENLPKDVFYSISRILYSLNIWHEFSHKVFLYTLIYKGNLNINYIESRGTLPILLVNEDRYNFFFSANNETLDFKSLFKNVDKSKLITTIQKHNNFSKTQYYKNGEKKSSITYAEINFRIIRDSIKELDSEMNWGNNQRAYIQQYMLLLSNFDILIDEVLKAIDDENIKKSDFSEFRKPNMSFDKMALLQKHINIILFKLKDEPYFFTILFSILVNRNIDKQLKVDKFIIRLDEIYEYSYNLFLGIKEIARNIVDHTETKKGVLCGRITNGSNIIDINDGVKIKSEKLLKEYFLNLDELNQKKVKKNILKDDYFQLTIFDEGQQGIVKKTIENIEKLVSNVADVDNLFKKDLEGLQSGKISLANFFNLQEFCLNHQSYKASAHWGLVIFTNLINTNFGFLSVSTKNNFDDSKIDSCIIYNNSSNTLPEANKSFSTGTKYEILLPLDKAIELSNPKISNYIPKGIRFSTNGYLNLLNFEFKDETNFTLDNQKWYLIRFNILKYWKDSDAVEYRKEYDVAEKLSKEIKKTIHAYSIIPVLDFENTYGLIDHSKLLRLLGSLQLGIRIESLIIINVKDDIIVGLNNIMDLNDMNINYMSKWNPKQFVLLFSYKENETGNRMYHTDILGGSTIQEYKLLKNKLSSTHPTITEYSFSDIGSDFSEETKKSIKECPFFIDDSGIVKNFEMILSFNGKSFYECFLEYNLNSEISNVEYGYSGYKIENSHFKLGSKTHIKDFIYAKRIFQNSFFTDRFAFQIAKYYIENYPENYSLTIIGYGEYSQMLINRVEKILIAFFENKLKSSFKNGQAKEFDNLININHDMISDIETLDFIKKEKFNSKILVIVPINTTLSTTIKIEDLINEKIDKLKSKEKISLITPSLNLILVTHKNLEDNEYVNALNSYLRDEKTDNNRDYPYNFFYWKNVDLNNKIITVGTNPQKGSSDIRKQKYFITIESEWYLPEQCESCFPVWNNELEHIDGILNEKPLLETDKTSVTPDLLLDLPISFSEQFDEESKDEISISTGENKREIIITEKSLKSKHLTYKGNHHLHFIEPLPFFNHYKNQIEKWAEEIRINLLKECPKILNSSILLISPSERNNTYFVELINRLVFEDSGVIIHYEVTGDYTENYQKFFSGNIKQSDFIFYVDDFIQSGKTFHLVNDFIRYCNKEESNNLKTREPNKTCDGVFTLISKTDNYSKGDIIAQINPNSGIVKRKFNAFYYLFLNNINPDKCPLCKEQKRYVNLAKISMLDTVKYYFLNKANNLEAIDIKNASQNNNGWIKFHPFVFEYFKFPWSEDASEKNVKLYNHFCTSHIANRNYLKLLIQNELNKLLSTDNEIRELFKYKFQSDTGIKEKIEHTANIFKLLLAELKQSVFFRSWFDNKEKDEIYNIYEEILDELLIKVITLQPYSNIKDIKEKTFFWILYRLDLKIDEFIASQDFNFRKFRGIKFLLRRVTILGSNYIIRKKTLQKFQKIYSLYSSSAKQKNEQYRSKKAKYYNEEFKKIIDETDQLNSYSIDLKNNNTELFPAERALEIEERIKLLNFRRDYIIQALRNLQYIEVSLNEFNYFFVSIVKEVTAFNDSKVLKLEQNIDAILTETNEKESPDFYFLLRVLKLENTFIVKNAIDLIFKECFRGNKLLYFNNKFSSKELRKELDSELTKIIDDYRLYAFRIYYGIKEFSTWKKTNIKDYHILLEIIYLYSCLKHDSDKNFDIPTELKTFNKTKSILRNFYRISTTHGLDNENISLDEDIKYNDDLGNGAFLVLKTSNEKNNSADPKNLLVAYATEPYRLEDDYKIYNTPFDEFSLSYVMFKGLTNRKDLISNNIKDVINWVNSSEGFIKSQAIEKGYPKKPWTIWEIEKQSLDDTVVWNSIRGNVYLIQEDNKFNSSSLSYSEKNHLTISNDFTEKLYLTDEINNLSLLRLTNIQNVRGSLKNECEAIIAIFSSDNNLNIERTKLSLMLLPLIRKFITNHYDSDNLKDFIEERNEKLNILKIKHGFPRYLRNLRNRAVDYANDEDKKHFAELLGNLITPWETILSMLEVYKKFIDKQEINPNNTELEVLEILNCTKIKIKDLGHKIEYYFNLIIKNEIGGTMNAFSTDQIKCYTDYNEIDEQEIPISFSIFLIILTEALVNMKKNRSPRDLYFLYYKISLSDCGYVMLELTNNSDKLQETTFKILKKNNKNNKHGLGLINYITHELFERNIEIDYKKSHKFEGNEFSLIFPIAKSK